MHVKNRFLPVMGRLVGFGVIAAAWTLLASVLLVFLLAYGMWADLKSPRRSHWTAGTWAQALAWQLYAADYEPMWSAQDDCSEFDEQLLYVPKPGVAHFVGSEFDTTIRMTPSRVRAQPPAPIGAPLVVMAGDSYTMGWGVNDTETFSYQLQQRYGYHTVNTGVASYGTARELTRLRRMGLLTNIDVLVIQYCDNDLPENVEYLKDPVKFFTAREPRRTWMTLRHYRQQDCTYVSVLGHMTALVRARIAASGVRDGIASILADKPVPFGRLSNRKFDQGQEMASSFLAVLAQFPELKNTPIVVTEMSPHAGYTGFTDALRAMAKDRPNIIPVSIHYTPDDFFRFDWHLTPQGHRTAAAQLDAALKRVLAGRTLVPNSAALHPGF